MIGFRLFIVGLVKLACVAGFVWLALNGLATWAWPLLILALLTRFPAAAAPPPAKPAAVPSTSKAA